MTIDLKTIEDVKDESKLNDLVEQIDRLATFVRAHRDLQRAIRYDHPRRAVVELGNALHDARIALPGDSIII